MVQELLECPAWLGDSTRGGNSPTQTLGNARQNVADVASEAQVSSRKSKSVSGDRINEQADSDLKDKGPRVFSACKAVEIEVLDSSGESSEQ